MAKDEAEAHMLGIEESDCNAVTMDMSDSSSVRSLFETHCSPPPSALARKRQLPTNPPSGIKKGKGAATSNPKGV